MYRRKKDAYTEIEAVHANVKKDRGRNEKAQINVRSSVIVSPQILRQDRYEAGCRPVPVQA